MPQKKIKHLEMIEKVIERMAKNSFQLKGWTMTLVTAVIALASQGEDIKFILLAFIPILGFWILDSFYLREERRYVLLYNNITQKREEEIDFSMSTKELVTTIQEKNRLCFLYCMFSFSESCFYPFIMIAIIVIIVWLKIC